MVLSVAVSRRPHRTIIRMLDVRYRYTRERDVGRPYRHPEMKRFHRKERQCRQT